MEIDDYHFKLKIVLMGKLTGKQNKSLGDKGVGKTTFLDGNLNLTDF
jgi:hypothetical protein